MVSKVQERIFVETASKLLGANWQILDIPEPPDFEIRTASEIFGLEVSQIFTNTASAGGSPAKKAESARSRIIGDLANRYYQHNGAPISAQFIGLPKTNQLDPLVKAMVKNAPTTRGSHTGIQYQGIKISMTPAPPNYSRWTYIDDRVGWLRLITSSDIQPVIQLKQSKLSSYQQKYPNMILLLVADRTLNSGKLELNSPLHINNPGFHSIYFLSYPATVHKIA